ncbi:MAG: hypothetical protein B6D59_04040 [Campylobacteraceae bacterium 4484_4]|nr:MAG: hypothetical protein B6D59_04040 [Campylobacteraceae bacterium 4484_4]
MFGALAIERGATLQIDLQNGMGKTDFECIKAISFENRYNIPAKRYYLKEERSGKRSLLDIEQDLMKNFTITWYEEVEEMPFDLNFLSLVGTSPLGYHNPKYPNIDYIMYQRISDPTDETELLTFYVTEDELPERPEENGYFKDANGNWYFLTRRASGALLHFENRYRLCWHYRQDQDERLMIEMDAYRSMTEYTKYRPSIHIYEGRVIKRRDIKLLAKSPILHEDAATSLHAS